MVVGCHTHTSPSGCCSVILSHQCVEKCGSHWDFCLCTDSGGIVLSTLFQVRCVCSAARGHVQSWHEFPLRLQCTFAAWICCIQCYHIGCVRIARCDSLEELTVSQQWCLSSENWQNLINKSHSNICETPRMCAWKKAKNQKNLDVIELVKMSCLLKTCSKIKKNHCCETFCLLCNRLQNIDTSQVKQGKWRLVYRYCLLKMAGGITHQSGKLTCF